MNLLTDELKDRFLPRDWQAVQERLNCIEMMHLRWMTNMACGQVEDAAENIDDMERCTTELADMEEAKRIADCYKVEHRLTFTLAVLKGGEKR